MMNIELLKKYIKPGAMVYLLHARENYFGQEVYYIPCRVVNMEFESLSSYCGVNEIPRFELKFDLVHATDPKMEYREVKSKDVYIIYESGMCGLQAFLYKKEHENDHLVDAFRYTYYSRDLHNSLVKALPGKFTPIDPFEPDYFDSKKIIFSGSCTIVIWKDGTKTIARCNKWDDFSPEAGLAICFMKHVLGESKAKKILRNGNKIFESEAEG